MLRAVIFDFDGVITDSEILHLRSFNLVLPRYGIELTKKDYYRNYLGLSDRDLFELFNREKSLGLDSDGIEELVIQKNRLFEKMAKTEGQIIEGVRGFLEVLTQNKISTAICSGALTSEIKLILEGAGLESSFEVIVSAEHVKKGKPDPEGFVLALKKLNEKKDTPISASHCVVIEDSHWGLEAAKAAGMHTVAVTNSYDADQLSQAEMVVNNLSQLKLSRLNKLCN